ncbi:3',5'-cyclic-AMP phosphodiesterase [Endozoicomonas sp. SM1973]|uniref:3',5'-cyclic-AMP phosphodiesterase n=1 Tax=Spartinivicinus marinus TaxID=2994442 RepID=A0A853I4T0_9GAMM|nr:3',5'-cyclic-AMP phosphodiesterase [Spartinivicinus marinus]MCX4026089.1 3',5'-cyclic-AMP phosphodiesterase [Spartinivicinus marinus]NYZ66572.1 3',5'-cyclic-AMP phosphodiesterase [Spartinivicinus marinus]
MSVNTASQVALRILQVTDSHLYASQQGQLLGVNTQDSLKAVLIAFSQLQREVDLMLVTGDISQDGSPESYQRFVDCTASYEIPQRWIAGNHDEYLLMQQLYKSKPCLNKAFVAQDWQVLMLNSNVPGKVYGELADEELNYLKQQLDNSTAKYTMICLHHHTLPVGCDWLDNIGLRNADKFNQLIDQYDQVKLVLCGHIHQELDRQDYHARYLGSPSTCVQFARHSSEFKLDNLAPGFRLINLMENGDIVTSVHRAEQFNFQIDEDAIGY